MTEDFVRYFKSLRGVDDYGLWTNPDFNFYRFDLREDDYKRFRGCVPIVP